MQHERSADVAIGPFQLAALQLLRGLGDRLRVAWVGPSPSRAEIEELLGDDGEAIDVVFGASIADVLESYVSDQRLRDALFGQGITGFFGGPRDPGSAISMASE